MGKSVKYSQEMRERAVRMVRDHEHEYPTRCEATESIAGKFGALQRRCDCRNVRWSDAQHEGEEALLLRKCRGAGATTDLRSHIEYGRARYEARPDVRRSLALGTPRH